MSSETNEFKEVKSIEEVHEVLEEMKKSWEDICEVFGVDPEKKIESSLIKSNIKMTLIDLNEIENMEYVKKSNKPLEKLHQVYLKDLIKFAYSNVDDEETEVWKEEVENYLKTIFTDDILNIADVELKEDKEMTMDKLFEDINRIFSISNQLNVIRAMESQDLSAETFMSLESNYIYLGIGIVQICNGNAVVMGKVVTSLKVIIKINDMILKSITSMLRK